MFDVVIPYRHSPSDELRYTLRGIARNVEHRNVFIVGDCPAWAKDVIHIGTKRLPKYRDVENSVSTACKDERVSEYFWLFNDDIFVLKKGRIPVWYNGTIQSEYQRRAKVAPFDEYSRGFDQTDRFLKSLGISKPLNYALHIPVMMNKTKRLVVSELISQRLKGKEVISARNVYGNIFRDNLAAKHQDVKYMRYDANFAKHDIMSTSDASFIHGEVGRYISSKLPKKCRYER